MSKNTISAPRRRLCETDFSTWVGLALPGDILEYHRGFLAIDVAMLSGSLADQKALRLLARRAAWASERGLVHLVQRRIGPSEFGYLAVKRPRPRGSSTRTQPLALDPGAALQDAEAA